MTCEYYCPNCPIKFAKECYETAKSEEEKLRILGIYDFSDALLTDCELGVRGCAEIYVNHLNNQAGDQKYTVERLRKKQAGFNQFKKDTWGD